MSDADKLLVLKLIEGNEPAFDVLFQKYYKISCLFAMKYVNNMSVSEDLCQDVFVKVWINKETIDSSHSFKSFLFTMVRNRCIDYIRHNKIESKYVKESQGVPLEDDDDMVEEQEKLLIIYNLIEELPEKCKAIFKMSRFDNLKYHEIAVKLGLSVKTVENQIGKALKQIRGAIKK